MFSLVGKDVVQVKETVSFNTDSIFDLLTGDVRRGYDGKWYINGGWGPAIAGVLGRSGMFKSTLTASLMMRLSALYQVESIIADSEGSITRSTERICRMAGNLAKYVTTENVVSLDAKNQYDLALLLKFIREIGEKKKAMKDDAMITTPFLDKNGERIKVYVPTPLFIDSFSELSGTAEDTMLSTAGLDDSKTKTAYMLDANQKTLFLRTVSRYAQEYGIDIITTAHYGQKLNMDSFLPPPKMLQYMGQNEAAKNVGSKFYFLTSPQVLIASCTKCQDDAKQCKFKLTPNNSPTELSELVVLMQRCKNNSSGLTHPFIISQENGLLTEASDYNFLKSNKMFSMQGNNVTHQSVFYPEKSMTRNSFRGLCAEDPKLTRALQLGAQLLYVQMNWSDSGWAFPLKVDPKKLVDVLLSDKCKMTKERILNSRGYWLPDELITPETPEYLSIFDILEMAGSSGLLNS